MTRSVGAGRARWHACHGCACAPARGSRRRLTSAGRDAWAVARRSQARTSGATQPTGSDEGGAGRRQRWRRWQRRCEGAAQACPAHSAHGLTGVESPGSGGSPVASLGQATPRAGYVLPQKPLDDWCAEEVHAWFDAKFSFAAKYRQQWAGELPDASALNCGHTLLSLSLSRAHCGLRCPPRSHHRWGVVWRGQRGCAGTLANAPHRSMHQRRAASVSHGG